mmetsp:Transcript_4294/g.4813  ORF Transcript_4294/g.4813 Transcript_4294/m.4813 type:complete len:389 (+) Transcript_4294:60-1226(+)
MSSSEGTTGSTTAAGGGLISSFRRAREWAYPQLTSSAFLEKGVLTPAEFVMAGDELVFRCPTWEWASSSNTSAAGKKESKYLPPDKQYLITRNVPCQYRVSSLETNLTMEMDDNNDDELGEEWMVSSIVAQGEGGNKNNEEDNIEDDFDILDDEGELIEKTTTMNLNKDKEEKKETEAVDIDDDDDDDEYGGDMDDYYEDDDILVDDDVAVVAPNTADNDNTNSSNKTNTNHDTILKTRTYDLSITYDKYYQVPRIWMVGRNENDQPLTGSQMMEDVISDYANKTVTMEVHPFVHSSCPHMSIHPCQHAKVMKTIVKNLLKGSTNNSKGNNSGSGSGSDETQQDNHNTNNDGQPSVETYIFIFLKFVSSMIPTINYDFTMEVSADTSK